MRAFLPLPLIAAASLLGGCALSGTVYNDSVDDAYSPAAANAAVRDGALPTAVFGTPVAGVSAEAALAPLSVPGAIAAKRLALAPPDAITRLVLVFDHKGGSVAANSVCTAQPIRGALLEQDGVLTVTAAYCVGGRLNSIATAAMAQPASVDDPAYADTVAQALVTIFPSTATLPIVLPFN